MGVWTRALRYTFGRALYASQRCSRLVALTPDSVDRDIALPQRRQLC